MGRCGMNEGLNVVLLLLVGVGGVAHFAMAVEAERVQRAPTTATTALWDVTVFGFSESRNLMAPISSLLGCEACCGDNSVCITDPRWRAHEDTGFLTQCSDELTYQTVSCRCGGSLHYQWISSARLSTNFTKEVHSRHALGRQQVVIYSLGPHFFAQFPNHSKAYYRRDLPLPPLWSDAFDSQVDQLMARLAKLPACVVWKTNNLGSRVPDHNISHPNVQGGLNDVLGRRATAMAARHGLIISDISPVTLNYSREHHNFASGNEDFYHAYDNMLIAKALLSTVQRECRHSTCAHASHTI